MLRFTLIIFGLCILSSTRSMSKVTHEEPKIFDLDIPLTGRLFFNPAPKFFSAYQTDVHYDLNNASPTISMQGNLHTINLNSASIVNLMIDEQILLMNKLFPNNDRRLGMANMPGEDLWSLDWRGGVTAFSIASKMTVSGSKLHVVYLPAGNHSIDVVGRTWQRVLVEGFELLVEVNDVPEGADMNLPLLFPASE